MMNKKGMSVLTMLVLLMALAIGAAISVGDMSPEQVDVIVANITTPVVNANMSSVAPELENAFNYYVNGMLSAYMEIMKWTMSYAAENPEVPYKLLLYLLILSIFAPLLLLLFKFIIIIFLLIKEYFQKRKENRRWKQSQTVKD